MPNKLVVGTFSFSLFQIKQFQPVQNQFRTSSKLLNQFKTGSKFTLSNEFKTISETVKTQANTSLKPVQNQLNISLKPVQTVLVLQQLFIVK